MKTSQLNAISKSYAAKRSKESESELVRRGLDVVYKWQTSYKTLSGFLKASDAMISKCEVEALERLTDRVEQLKKTNCKSYVLDEASTELEKVRCICRQRLAETV